MGEKSDMVLGSRRVEPMKLRESGFKFQHSDLPAALAAMF